MTSCIDTCQPFLRNAGRHVWSEDTSTHIEPCSIVLHSIQHLFNRTLIHKVPQRLPRRPIDGLCRGLVLRPLLKDMLADGSGRTLGGVDGTIHLVERMLAAEKGRIARSLVKPRGNELYAEGLEDGIEG